ncbi:hypothetical protein B0H13DRAFT_1594487 [Mycena leptocephala]|nr:hypothetical protein B0H13DRAFT_1594487 [Mycena leptocephala]
MPFKCRQCPHREFNSRTALFQHYRQSIGHPFCLECDKYYSTTEAFEAASSIHPNCSRCGKGFLNAQALPHHYIESAQHPSCAQCIVGFKDDVAYNAHGAAEHADRRCTECQRQFNTKDELKDHFNKSVAHPKCTKCKVGFLDDTALDKVGQVYSSPKIMVLIIRAALYGGTSLAAAYGDRPRSAAQGNFCC